MRHLNDSVQALSNLWCVNHLNEVTRTKEGTWIHWKWLTNCWAAIICWCWICSCWEMGELILHPSQSQIGGWVVKIPLVSKSFILLPQCLIERFQSLAVSLPETYWNSLGVIHASWNQIQGPFEPWHNLERYIRALFVPHSISKITSSSRTWNYRTTFAGYLMNYEVICKTLDLQDDHCPTFLENYNIDRAHALLDISLTVLT